MKTKGNIKDIYPLSPMQEGMLFHSLYGDIDSVYFEQISYRLHGDLNISIVNKSLDYLLDRYDILRTLFIYEGRKRPLQVVLEKGKIDFYYEDLRENEDPLQKVETFKEEDKQRYFSFQKEFSIRVSVMRLGESEYEFIWSHHHILMDGWCKGILISEFFEIYNRFLEGKTPRLPGTVQYGAFIKWLEKQDREASKHHWREYLNDFEGGGSIPGIKPGSAGAGGYRHGREVFQLEKEETAALNRLAGKNNVTLNTVAQAVWGILLGKYNGNGDVVFGAVVSGRPPGIKGVESIVGLFINTIPVRIRFEGKTTFNRLLRQIQEEAVANEPHHSYPLVEIQSETVLKQNLIDHILVFENFPITEQLDGVTKGSGEDHRGLVLELSNIDRFGRTSYDFNMVVAPGSQIKIRMDYNCNLYQREFVERIINHFKRIILQILDNEEIVVDDITLLSHREREQLLYKFNDTEVEYPAAKTIHELFEEQVGRKPHYISAAFGDRKITYKTLDDRSGQLAGLLRDKGVTRGSIVGLMMEPSLDIVIAIMALLRIGSAYLPIAPKSPEHRTLSILSDSNAHLLLVQKELLHRYEEIPETLGKERIIPVDDEKIFSENNPCKHLTRENHPENVAYVIYTSGTSGKPKGVLVNNRNLVNYVSWFSSEAGLRGDERTVLTSSYAFDLGYTTVFPPLLTGGTLHLAPQELYLSPGDFLNYTWINRITYLKVTPSLFGAIAAAREFSAGALKYLKLIVMGGEAININDVEKMHAIAGHVRVMNHYGPTETTIGSVARFIDFDKFEEYRATPTIGKAIDNTNAFILDKRLKLVPIGLSGELCIGGDGVARGYLNRPELTAEKFVSSMNRRIYRTGDLARWTPDGNIEFLGRLDFQVKIRGFRIELGEIENRLLKHDKIKEAAVIDREEKKGGRYLCAYIVTDGGGEAGEPPLFVSGLKEYLGRSLPEYMIPMFFVEIEKIPLTPNGKIDRKALPEPGLQTAEVYMGPRNEVEKKMVELWSEVLSIEKEKIGIDDNFFELGGHSLKATVLTSRVHKELNVKLPLAEIFNTATIRGLAEYIKKLPRQRYARIKPVEKKDYYPLASSQHRLYFLQQFSPGSVAYNMPQVVILEGELSVQRLEETFRKLIKRHESLRTSFDIVKGIPVQRIRDDFVFAVEYHSLEIRGSEEEDIIKNFVRPFKLNRVPLVRVGIIRLEEEEHILMLDMHHITTDGVSQNIFIQEFIAIYAGEELPPLKLQFKDFSEWQNGDGERNLRKKQEEYWLKVFQGELPVLKLPTDYPRPEKLSYEGGIIQSNIPGKETEALKALALQEGVTLHILLMSIYSVLVSKICSQEDLVVGMAIAGRNHADIEHIIGMFLNMLAIRVFPRGENTFKEFLQGVRTRTVEAYDNQDYPFEDLVEKLRVNRETNRNPLFDTAFGLQNMDVARVEIPGLKLKPYKYEGGISKIDLLMVAEESGDNTIRFILEYNSKLFRKETVERFVEYFKRIVTSILENPAKRLDEIEMITEEEKNWVLSKKEESAAAIQIDFDI